MGDLAQGKHLPTQQQLVQSTPGPPFINGTTQSRALCKQNRTTELARALSVKVGFMLRPGLKFG